jgi:hypothetical protein
VVKYRDDGKKSHTYLEEKPAKKILKKSWEKICEKIFSINKSGEKIIKSKNIGSALKKIGIGRKFR